MGGGRLRRPLLINYQSYIKTCKDGGANIFQKSQVNQPNQGHQPWQSNSLLEEARDSEDPRKAISNVILEHEQKNKVHRSWNLSRFARGLPPKLQAPHEDDLQEVQ